jgi:hypothetical protein
MSTVLAKMAVIFSGNTASLDSSLRKSGHLVDNFSSKLAGLASGISVGLIGREVIRSFAEFQYEMSKVQAITGATGKDFKDLRNNAIELGGSLGFTAKEVASLQLEFGRLGFSTKEILNSSKAAVLLSKATGEDLARSAEIAGSTLRSFNLDASEMNRITDVMAAAFNKTALGLSDFGESIKYVAPVAAAAGLSLEQVSAMLGVLADNGIKGSMAGTSLRKIISDLGQGAAPMLTKKLAEMAKAGLSGADAMDEVGRTAYASLLVLSKNTDKVDAATASFSNVNGELQKMADIMTDNLVGDWDKLGGAVDAAIQKFGQGKDSEARKWLQEITAGVKMLSDETLGWTQKLELLFSPDWETKWKTWANNVQRVADHQDKLTKWDAQLLINKYNGIEEAMNGLNDMTVFAAAMDKESTRQFQNKEAILDELQSRLTARNEASAKGLKNESDAAIAAAMAFNELAKSYSSFLRAKATGEKSGLGTFQQGPVSSLSGFKPASFSNKKAKDPMMLESIMSPDGMESIIKMAEESEARYKEITDRIVEHNMVLAQSFSELATNILVAVGSGLGGGEKLGLGLLKALAAFGQKYGAQLIAIGAAKIAEGVATYNPAAVAQGKLAIAKGAALVVGSSALSSFVGNAGGSSGRGNASLGGTDRGSVNSSTQNSYEFRIRGKDLVAIAAQAEQDNRIRRGG